MRWLQLSTRRRRSGPLGFTNRKMKPTTKKRVYTFVLNLGLVFVLLLSLEVYSRFHVQLTKGAYVPSWRFNHVPKANNSVRTNELVALNPDFPPFERNWNKQGWAESYDVEPTKPDDTYRIFYIGDSFVEGMVATDESLPSLVEQGLEQRVRGRDLRFEVINAGVASYSPVLYYIRLRYQIMDFDPDLAVVVVDMTDDFDDWKYRLTVIHDSDGNPAAAPPRDIFASEFIDTRRGAVKATFWTRLQLFFFSKSHFFAYLSYLGAEKLATEVNTPLPPDSEKQIYQRGAWCRDEWDSFTKENVDLTFDVLRRLAETCKRNGIKLMLTAVPHYEQYANNDQGEEPPLWSARPHQELSPLASEIGVPYLNAFEALKPHFGGAARQRYYYLGDMHLNPRGNRLWADAHLEFLTDPGHDLLPKSFYSSE